MSIRQASGDSVDWETLHRFLNENYAYMAARIDPPSSLLRMCLDDLKTKAVEETLFLSEEDGKLVGCLFAQRRPDCIYVGKLAVSAHHRGQGIARKLIEKCADLAKSLSLGRLELETRIELTENHETFRKLGFEIVREEGHAGYDRPTYVVMQRELTKTG